MSTADQIREIKMDRPIPFRTLRDEEPGGLDYWTALKTLAHEIAEAAHEGQTDKLGADYYRGHLCRVSEAAEASAASLPIFGELVGAVGVLHDLLEDTAWTADDLRALCIPEFVVKTVERLTRQEGESYADFIGRLTSGTHSTERMIALLVKRADILDNGFNLDRPAPASLVKRYATALGKVQAALTEDIASTWPLLRKGA